MKIAGSVMKSVKNRRFASTLLVSTMLGFGVQSALAATFVVGGSTKKVTVVSETNAQLLTNNSGTYVNLPGAFTNIFVPANTRQLIRARYAAESECFGGFNWCSVRILVNGLEMRPTVGLDFAFDSTNGGSEVDGSWESHSMDRSQSVSGGTNGTTYSVQVQWANTGTDATFRLDDWALTVEQN